MTPNIFAGAGIDRAAERRRDAAWITERLADRRSRFAPVWRERNLFAVNGGAPAGAWLSAAEVAWCLDGACVVFLGMLEEVAHFAFEVAHDDPPERFAGLGGFGDLKRHGMLLDPTEAGLLAFARGMLHWHARHRFCGECGAETEAREAGHVRACTRCGALHFPRTDPAVIVLVTRGERCLLGRQAAWDPGRYATLAGFVEPGESLEDAVAREVREETGVRVGEVRYHSSQPWPFPASLMIGFAAAALNDEIRLDDELEDARWFTREEIRRGLADGSFSMPNEVSISHRLIAEWLDP